MAARGGSVDGLDHPPGEVARAVGVVAPVELERNGGGGQAWIHF
jgi:hypothetical protein